MRKVRLKSFRDVFPACGGRLAMSKGIPVPYGTLNSWWYRNSIPERYFSKLVELSSGRGFRVTLNELRRLKNERQAQK